MSIEQKQERLKQLRREQFPSDQDLEEIMQLEDELNIIHKEETQFTETEVSLGNGKVSIVPLKPKLEKREVKKKKTIFQWINEKIKEKPVTQEEIDELKKRVIKWRLKADIEKSKASIRKSKSSGGGLKDLFGPTQSNRKEFKSSDVFGSLDYRHEDSKSKINLRRKTLGY